jgi:cytochrome c oxidase assembly protein subunit 15
MENRTARLKRIRILAVALVLLSLLILLVSAYIRFSGAGLGCSPWPDCYGQLLAGAANLHGGAARILHRSVASLALVLGFVLVAQCLRPQPIQPAARWATALLSLMIVLTFVGLFSADPHRVWPGFINILGGAGLVLLSWRTALAAGADPARSPPRRPAGIAPCRGGGAGADDGAGRPDRGALRRHGLPHAAGLQRRCLAGSRRLERADPFTVIAAAAGPGDAGGVALHLLHRYCALATLLLLGLGGLQGLARPASAGKRGPAPGAAAGPVPLGVLTVLSGFSLWMAIAHSVCASLLLAATLQLLTRPAD